MRTTKKNVHKDNSNKISPSRSSPPGFRQNLHTSRWSGRLIVQVSAEANLFDYAERSRYSPKWKFCRKTLPALTLRFSALFIAVRGGLHFLFPFSVFSRWQALQRINILLITFLLYCLCVPLV